MSVMTKIEKALFPCLRKLDGVLKDEDAVCRIQRRVAKNKGKLKEALREKADSRSISIPH